MSTSKFIGAAAGLALLLTVGLAVREWHGNQMVHQALSVAAEETERLGAREELADKSAHVQNRRLKFNPKWLAAQGQTISVLGGQMTPLASGQSASVARWRSRSPSITSIVPLAVWATKTRPVSWCTSPWSKPPGPMWAGS